MKDFKSNHPEIEYKHNRIVRVISHFKNGHLTTGTGFIVGQGRYVMTCWHVVSGTDLKALKENHSFQASNKSTDIEKVEEYFQDKSSHIEVKLPNDTKIAVNLVSYDHYYDVAVLEIVDDGLNLPYFEFETVDSLDYSDEIIYCGYPDTLGYNSEASPFTVNTGTVSSFPEIEVAGGKYQNIQLNSICLGGNSGAPLFKKGQKKVYGIINGFQWKGYDNLAIFENGTFTRSVSHKVPLNISFATSIKIIADKSTINKSTFLNTKQDHEQ